MLMRPVFWKKQELSVHPYLTTRDDTVGMPEGCVCLRYGLVERWTSIFLRNKLVHAIL